MTDSNPLADLVLTHEHIYLLEDADFQAFTVRLNHRRGADVRLVASDGVVIVAPVDGWRVCECDVRSDDSGSSQ